MESFQQSANGTGISYVLSCAILERNKNCYVQMQLIFSSWNSIMTTQGWFFGVIKTGYKLDGLKHFSEQHNHCKPGKKV